MGVKCEENPGSSVSRKPYGSANRANHVPSFMLISSRYIGGTSLESDRPFKHDMLLA